MAAGRAGLAPGLAACVVAGAAVVGAVYPAAASPTTYYVDARGGDDAHAGTSPGAAWRSLAKVNRYRFAPGDRIVFRNGRTWTGTLRLSSHGTPGRPITVGSYGLGPRPVVTGGETCVAVAGSW